MFLLQKGVNVAKTDDASERQWRPRSNVGFITTLSGRSHAVPEVVVSRDIGDRNDDSNVAGDARELKPVISVLSPV